MKPQRKKIEAETSSFSTDLASLLLGWDKLERSLGAEPIVDFNVSAVTRGGKFSSRYEVLLALTDLHKSIPETDYKCLTRTTAHLTYLRALMGQRYDFADYTRLTIGTPSIQFDNKYIALRSEQLRAALESLGLPFDASTEEKLEAKDRVVALGQLRRELKTIYNRHVLNLSDLMGRDLHISYFVQFVEVDAYWKYWVDGNAKRFRLRINGKTGRFGYTELVQFVYHELLAHCCQMASWQQKMLSAQMDLFHGLTTVHGPEQFLFEGLAQSLPLFISTAETSDPLLLTRIRLAHLRSLVSHNIHIMINSGATVEECVQYSLSWLPFARPSQIAHGLSSRSNHVLFRTYQFVYPLSMDYFITISEQLDPAGRQHFLSWCYSDALYYSDLLARYHTVHKFCK